MHAYFVLWPTFSNLACSHDPIAVNFTELRGLFLHFGTDSDMLRLRTLDLEHLP